MFLQNSTQISSIEAFIIYMYAFSLKHFNDNYYLGKKGNFNVCLTNYESHVYVCNGQGSNQNYT